MTSQDYSMTPHYTYLLLFLRSHSHPYSHTYSSPAPALFLLISIHSTSHLECFTFSSAFSILHAISHQFTWFHTLISFYFMSSLSIIPSSIWFYNIAFHYIMPATCNTTTKECFFLNLLASVGIGTGLWVRRNSLNADSPVFRIKAL